MLLYSIFLSIVSCTTYRHLSWGVNKINPTHYIQTLPKQRLCRTAKAQYKWWEGIKLLFLSVIQSWEEMRKFQRLKHIKKLLDLYKRIFAQNCKNWVSFIVLNWNISISLYHMLLLQFKRNTSAEIPVKAVLPDFTQTASLWKSNETLASSWWIENIYRL